MEILLVNHEATLCVCVSSAGEGAQNETSHQQCQAIINLEFDIAMTFNFTVYVMFIDDTSQHEAKVA